MRFSLEDLDVMVGADREACADESTRVIAVRRRAPVSAAVGFISQNGLFHRENSQLAGSLHPGSGKWRQSCFQMLGKCLPVELTPSPGLLG